ncbi:MAG: hypothetical protein V1699_03500 [Candidatus Omnitrophota bacterium]
MNTEKTGFSAIKSAYNLTFKSLKNNPILFAPFAIFAFFELLSLIIIYLAPRMPLRLVLGPMIKAFWSESYLHYPNNFLLLSKLSYLARMALAISIGSILSAIAITIVLDIYHKKQVNLKNSLFSALKNYPSFFIIIFISVFLYYFAIKIFTSLLLSYFLSGHGRLVFLPARFWMGPVLFCVNFILAIIIQSAFIYAIPIIIIEKEKLIKAIFRSFIFFKKLFVPTIILVSLPMLILIPISVLSYNTPFLINKFFPELILYIAFLGMAVNSLIVDPLITVSTAFLYLQVKKK